MKERKWRNYAFEFFSIFVAVISAFALNNWNDNRRDHLAETKILAEIYSGLEKDLQDVSVNEMGHEFGLKACAFWNNVVNAQGPINLDTLQPYYFEFMRDFISIQNTSGYEALKSKGFEIIRNDSLRTNIISLYEYSYQTLRKLEEDYFELQFHENYFEDFNKLIVPSFQFNATGEITDMDLPLNLSKAEKNLLLSHLWKIRGNRIFILRLYADVKEKIKNLRDEIAAELER